MVILILNVGLIATKKIGKEVKFTFTRPINISSIQIIQPSNAGEDIIDGADVQISTDGKNGQQ